MPKPILTLMNNLQLQERTIQDKFALIQLETDEIIEENESLAKRTRAFGRYRPWAIGIGYRGVYHHLPKDKQPTAEVQAEATRKQSGNLQPHARAARKNGRGKKSQNKNGFPKNCMMAYWVKCWAFDWCWADLNERNDPGAIEQRAELIVKLQELEEEIRTISHELNASAYQKGAQLYPFHARFNGNRSKIL